MAEYLSATEVKQILSRFTYKPEYDIKINLHIPAAWPEEEEEAWRLFMDPVDSARPIVQIHLFFTVIDVSEPHEPIRLKFADQFEPSDLTNKEALIAAVKRTIDRAEEHESQEWLRFNGRRITEPH